MEARGYSAPLNWASLSARFRGAFQVSPKSLLSREWAFEAGTASYLCPATYAASINIGDDADVVLVDGGPSKTIGDFRHTRIVMMNIALMDADALRAAGGFEGRPKFVD